MTKNNEYFKHIKQAAIEGKLVFFVGAGVSALSGYPGWTRLVQEFEKGVDKRKVDEREKHIKDYPDCPFEGYSSDEFLRIPQKFYAAKGKPKYNKILREFFDVEHEPNEIHDMMLELNPAHFITTNYDKLIEKACVKGHKNYSSISCDNGVAKVRSSNYILKVHGEFGDVIDGKDIVLKENDYIDYDANFPLLNNLVKSLVATNTVVFIGYSLNDYNINQMLNWVKRIQKNDFRHYFVRVDYNRLKASERKYYQKKGMNIIDVTTMVKSQKNDYRERYKYFMERLISENKWDTIKDQKSSLLHINTKLSELDQFNYIRRVDLKMVFDGDYYFYPSGKVHKSQTCEYDYFKEYIDYKNSDNRTDEMDKILNSIDEKLLWFGVGYLLDWNGEENEVKKSLHNQSTYIFQNLLYENKYDDIAKHIAKDAMTVEETLQTGFYMSGIGEWEKAYEIFTEVITTSYKKEDWVIYFVAQLNRYFLSRLITVMNRQLVSGYSRIVLGRTYKVFSDDFLTRVENESTFQLPRLIFDGMPNVFKTKYSFLKWLCDEVSFSNETSELSKLQFSCSKKVRQNSLYIGTDNDFKQLTMRINDNVKFCFENFLWTYPSSEFKGMVHIALTPLFEHISKNQQNNNSISFFGDEVQVNNSEYFIDYFEFIYIVKSYKLKDLKQALNGIRLADVRFDEMEKIEGYILRTLKYFEQQSNHGNDGIQVISYVLLSEEIKNILYLASNFILKEETLVYLVDFILNTIYERDLNVGERSFYVQKLLLNNEYNKKVMNIVDEFLIQKYKLRAIDKYEEFTTRSNPYQGLARAIKKKDKDYYHERLSNAIVNSPVNVHSKKQVDYLFVNLEILSEEAKRKLVKIKNDFSLGGILDLLDQGILDELPNVEDKIVEETEVVVNRIKENKLKGVRTIPEPTIRYTGILYVAGIISKKKIECFIGHCDEFDMFVDPENFDFENKINWKWFRFYSIKVRNMIFGNDIMRERIRSLMKKEIMERFDEDLVRIYMEYCTD